MPNDVQTPFNCQAIVSYNIDTVRFFPDSKVHVAHMGLTWVLLAPGGPHVGPMNIAIRVHTYLWFDPSTNTIIYQNGSKISYNLEFVSPAAIVRQGCLLLSIQKHIPPFFKENDRIRRWWNTIMRITTTCNISALSNYVKFKFDFL